jgi:hypothetical protein
MAITGPSTLHYAAAPGIAPYPQMTISMWIKPPTSETGTNYCFYVSDAPSTPSNNFNLHCAGTPSPNSFGSVAQSFQGTTIDCSMAGTTTNNVWHHVLATFDQTGTTAGQVKTVNIYIDGAFSFSTTAGGPVTGLTANNDPNSTDQIYPGDHDGGVTVDYAAVWKRILSTSEISALGAQGDPRIVTVPGPVSFVALTSATGPIPDLVNGGMSWVTVGTGSFTLVAAPFPQNQGTPPASLEYSDPWGLYRAA